MLYLLIGLIILIALLPVSIKNQTEYRQKIVKKKAAAYGIDLSFSEDSRTRQQNDKAV